MLKNVDLLLSFARFFDDEYKRLGGTLPVCVGKTIMSGDNMGNRINEGESFIRIDESNAFSDEIDVISSARAQTYNILIEMFFKKDNIYSDERSALDEILLGGVKFKVFRLSSDKGYDGNRVVDAQQIEGANPILVTEDYQHFFYYVRILRVYGG